MSTTSYAFAMGMLQGLTEFLPVSSSGHLQLFSLLFFDEDIPLLVDILLHLGTLFAVLIITRGIIVDILRSCWHYLRGRRHNEDHRQFRLLLAVLYSTLCTAPLAFLFKLWLLPSPFFAENKTVFLAAGFFCTACVLLLPRRLHGSLGSGTLGTAGTAGTAADSTADSTAWKDSGTSGTAADSDDSRELSKDAMATGAQQPHVQSLVHDTSPKNGNGAGHRTALQVGWKLAIILGLVQSFATLPGLSRSGLTISFGLLLGLSRRDAAYYSFLLAIPAILASFLLSLDQLQSALMVFTWVELGIGLLFAFLSGLSGLYLLRYIVNKAKLWVFSCYLFPLALFLLMWHMGTA